jgi:hypothetical protein
MLITMILIEHIVWYNKGLTLAIAQAYAIRILSYKVNVYLL